jgi:uncharacterized protein DUF6931
MPESKAESAASPGIVERAGLSEDAKSVFRENLTSAEYTSRLSEAGLFPDAVKCWAHALDGRSCVIWSLSCIRKLRPNTSPPEEAAMKTIERWLAEPNDENRRAAKAAADEAELSTPAGCVAVAVFFSGGSIAPPQQPEVFPPPHLTAKIAAGGILLAVVAEPAKAIERYQLCLQLGRDIVA